nr:MAG TPA: NinB protein [Caudoviricetes sp.]
MGDLLSTKVYYNGLKFLENGKIELNFIAEDNMQKVLKGIDKIKIYNLNSPKILELKLSKKYKKRSLDANAYAWVLISKLSQKLGVPKYEIYKNYIKDIGCFEPLPIKSDKIDAFKKIWESKGIGWILEIIDDSKLKGYKLCHAYYGSSVYDSLQMSRLIDLIVEDCKDQGIETMTPDELAELKSLWGTFSK